jgi:hypothetical protein
VRIPVAGAAVWTILFCLLLATAGVAVAGEVNRESLERFVAEKTAAAAAEWAATVERAQLLGLPLYQERDDGTTIALARFAEDGRPIYLITHNLIAARTVSTDKVWPGGSAGLALDGSGQELGIWDSGNVRDTHQELTGRVTNMDGAGLSNHSTHVAGTMIAAGVNASAQGMSSMATLIGHDFFDDTLEMAAEQLLPDPIQISNHSYGFISGWDNGSFGCDGNDPQWYWFGDVQVSTQEDLLFGYYIQDAADWDQTVYDSPNYLPVKSAGNDRGEGPGPGTSHCHWDGSANAGMGGWVSDTDDHPTDGAVAGGYDTIGGGAGSAKNNLTIGAVFDIPGGYTQPSDVSMSSFSGWGPTDDGRLKPDLVANGISLFSSIASGDTSYANFSGTSMSTPNTSGSIGLLKQHAQNLFGQDFHAAAMKALVIGTADESGPAPGPDYMFGWGLLNTATAASVLSNQATLVAPDFQLMEGTLADGATNDYQVYSDGSGPLTATLAWTDPAGAVPPDTAIDPPDANLVNDLDLRIVDPNGVTTYDPWVLDPSNPPAAATTGDNFRDNVEQVRIDAPAAGYYTVEVGHKGTLSNSDPQDFGLVVTGNLATAIFTDGFESGDTSAWSSTVP